MDIRTDCDNCGGMFSSVDLTKSSNNIHLLCHDCLINRPAGRLYKDYKASKDDKDKTGDGNE